MGNRPRQLCEMERLLRLAGDALLTLLDEGSHEARTAKAATSPPHTAGPLLAGEPEKLGEVPTRLPLLSLHPGHMVLQERREHLEPPAVVGRRTGCLLALEHFDLLAAEGADAHQMVQANLDDHPPRYLAPQQGAQNLPCQVDVRHRVSSMKSPFDATLAQKGSAAQDLRRPGAAASGAGTGRHII
jgi:hypothetical protein